MDAGRGVICRGPEGPYPGLLPWGVDVEELPSTADLLQEDLFLRFLASRKSKEVDPIVVRALAWSYRVREDASERWDQPTVFSTLTQTPIAVAKNIWEDDWGTFSERTLLENGLTRSAYLN